MNDERVLNTLKAMAWERAKGELRSILQTFYSDYDHLGNAKDSAFGELSKKIDAFIEDVEDNGLVD